MEPKFQSSFIPKGPVATGKSTVAAQTKERSLFGFLSLVIFFITVGLAVLVFGYKFYLKSRIANMGQELEAARAALEPETVGEFIRFDDRITSTQTLIEKHLLLSPLFQYLEASTPRTVRLTEFNYSATDRGLDLALKGQARSYTALAYLADIFSQNRLLKNQLFSDLNLDAGGNVLFSFQATVDPELLSYEREVERLRGSATSSTPN